MIDRKALVQRHNVKLTAIDPRSPLSIGNGNFAFTADVTGFTTIPDAYPAPGRYVERPGTLLGMQSSWGWHSTPTDIDPQLSHTRKEYQSPHGPVKYVDLSGATSATKLDGGTPEESWLRNNPHRLMLGSISLLTAGCRSIRPADLSDVNQELDLFTGLLTSAFSVGEEQFDVITACHPTADQLGFSVQGSANIRFTFPYGSEDWGNAADWSKPEAHSSELSKTHTGWKILRTLDDTQYTVSITTSADLEQNGPHEFTLSGGDRLDHDSKLEFCVELQPGDAQAESGADRFAGVVLASAQHWEDFWLSGGAIDFTGSTDPRAAELERRVILSQYLTAIHSAGAEPPQETGLMVNSWRGRFHLEMHWWHAAHFPVWNRPQQLERSLGWYLSIIDSARETAKVQGFPGVRWPKQVGPDGRESPSDIGTFLLWQQPHPIYLAELLRRASGDSVMAELAPLVFESAEFMAAIAAPSDNGYILGPPLVPAQESYGFMRDSVQNPTFELAYWSWALNVANSWREQLGLERNEHWDQVAQGMAPAPVRDGIYTAIAVEPFTIRHDHPSMLAALGVVPATELIDPATMSATLDDVLADWEWESTWGWDYPLMAMTAARLGRPHDALNALFLDRGKNTYLANGHNFQTDALPIYLPGNGGLLTAVALMTAGYDGGTPLPGFPQDGSWKVEYEGILPLP